MSRIDVREVQAWLGYAALQLGPAGLVGITLIAASGVFALVTAMTSDAQRLEQNIAQARAELQRAAPSAKPQRTPQTFLAQLPPAEELPQFIESVHRTAERAGLQIERAEYRSPALASGRVLHSQVVLPVLGPYPRVIDWLGEVMADNPSAAIDEISFQRDAAADGPLHARVVLSHYARSLP